MCNLSICYWSAKFHSWSVLYELYSKLLEVPHERNESCHKRGVPLQSWTERNIFCVGCWKISVLQQPRLKFVVILFISPSLRTRRWKGRCQIFPVFQHVCLFVCLFLSDFLALAPARFSLFFCFFSSRSRSRFSSLYLIVYSLTSNLLHVISLTFLKLSPWFLATDQDGLDPILSCLVHISLCVWPRKEICFRKPDCDCGTSGARKGAPWLAKPGSVKLRHSRQLYQHEGKQNISGIRPFCRHFGRP